MEIPLRTTSGLYGGNVEGWKRIIRMWNSLEFGESPAPKTSCVSNGTRIGQVAAGLKSLEQRLGMKLPKSYGDFMQASAGCEPIGFKNGEVFVLPDTVGPLKDIAPAQYEIWKKAYSEGNDEGYYRYPSELSSFRVAYLDYALVIAISENGNGILLLNPKELTPDGEWEAWELHPANPGIVRYPTFAHMMLDAWRENAKEAFVRALAIKRPPAR
jgi:hypothetical protein